MKAVVTAPFFKGPIRPAVLLRVLPDDMTDLVRANCQKGIEMVMPWQITSSCVVTLIASPDRHGKMGLAPFADSRRRAVHSWLPGVALQD